MSDSLPISQIQPLLPKQSRASYNTAREVEARAKVTQTTETPQFRKALDKLSNSLDKDEPLRDDVPRGYYLNVEV